MSIFHRFRRQPEEDLNAQQSTGAPEQLSEVPSTSQPELLSEAVPAAAGSLDGDSEEAVRFYNPYEGLSRALDSRGGIKGTYKLPQHPEFLFSEEATVHRRSWTENLTYYTGTGYLSGALLGGGQGIIAAARTRPEIGPDTMRLRVNRLLNMSGTRGRTAGNALGVLGLFYAALESGLGHYADGSVPEAATSVGAGFATGALFRAARGPRAAAVAGAVGAAAASALVGARATLNKNL